MIDDHSPNQTRQHDSPNESVHDNTAPVQQMRLTLSDRTLSIVALVFGSMALMGMLWAMSVANEAKRNADIEKMRVEGLTRAMIAHGIKDTYPHLNGEDD